MMENNIVMIMTMVILLASATLYYEGFSNDVDYVISELDGRKYLVRNLPDKANSSNLLALIRLRLIKLVEHCHIKYPNDERIKRLVTKFNPDNISENSASSKYTSYTVNKGEKIVMCIRQRNNKNELVDINTMMFVAIHELAHIMTEQVGHDSPEFWDNMRFLLKIALSEELQLYNYQPFHIKPEPYCATMITDTPLKMKSV
jgi:hypothetical protein